MQHSAVNTRDPKYYEGKASSHTESIVISVNGLAVIMSQFGGD